MDQVEQIRRAYFIDGKGIRQIAREGHHHRRAVRKSIRDAGPPRYTLSQPRARPVLDPFVAIIDRWLVEDERRPPKQRHTARRIYQRLMAEHGFHGGDSTVREYVRKRRPKQKSLFIPLAYEPGQDAQFDFGEALVMMKGCPLTVQLLVGRLCFSKAPFLMAFPNQQQEALFEGHKEAFALFGGVPHAIWYDQLSQAVKRALSGGRSEEQESFIAFRSHYLFQSRFCNPGEGHEKGLVENLVGYARRNFLVPVPEVESFEELNTLLTERCLAEAKRRLRGETLTIGELWEKERPHLLPLPSRTFPCCRTVPVHTNGFSLVTFQTNRYSVPVEHAHGPLLLLRAFVDRVEVTDGTELVATHRRSYEREQDILDPLHYLPLLRERPRAFDHAKPLKTWVHPPVLDLYLTELRARLPHRAAILDFLRVLELCLAHPLKEVAVAVEQAMASGSLGAETVLYFLRASGRPGQPIAIAPMTSAPPCPTVQDRDLSQYDRLLRR
ncbi:MAG: IS21 family transposase [Chloroflexota bacterium]|nr:IS21 family transposase [Chloroflexota bacterium]